MTSWIICLLIVALGFSVVMNQIYYLRIGDLRRDLADATDWMEPIVIGDPADED